MKPPAKVHPVAGWEQEAKKPPAWVDITGVLQSRLLQSRSPRAGGAEDKHSPHLRSPTGGSMSTTNNRKPKGDQLIAAAPDLLAALKALEAWGTKMCRVPRPDSPLAQARAAIAKAEGQ